MPHSHGVEAALSNPVADAEGMPITQRSVAPGTDARHCVSGAGQPDPPLWWAARLRGTMWPVGRPGVAPAAAAAGQTAINTPLLGLAAAGHSTTGDRRRVAAVSARRRDRPHSWTLDPPTQPPPAGWHRTPPARGSAPRHGPLQFRRARSVPMPPENRCHVSQSRKRCSSHRGVPGQQRSIGLDDLENGVNVVIYLGHLAMTVAVASLQSLSCSSQSRISSA